MDKQARIRTGRFGVQLLLLVLVFLVSAAILLCVFSGAWSMSRKAADMNNAVQLCRNAAEAFSSDGSVSAAAEAMGGTGTETVLYFDEKLSAVSQDKAVYRLELSCRDTPTQAGVLSDGSFCVYRGDNCLYTLDEQVYLPQEAAP